LLRMDWRASAAKVGVLIADAPPHGVGGADDRYPDGCPCGEDWQAQCESMREAGIVLHAVGCRGLREPHVFQRMAEITRGKYFHLSAAETNKLPELITGCADHDLVRALARTSTPTTRSLPADHADCSLSVCLHRSSTTPPFARVVLSCGVVCRISSASVSSYWLC
jgi:hypothetical protein